MRPLVAHQRAQDALAGVLANLSPDQFGAPTPCSEWTIHDLIEHVIGGNEYVGQWAGSHEEPPARPDDIVAAHRSSRAGPIVAPQFRGPGKPFGDEQPCLPGRTAADQLAAFLGRKV